MKIDDKEIRYVEYLCDMLPKILKDIKEEAKKNDFHIYQSPSRARFERLRIEINKSLIKIKKDIYKC